MNYENFEYISYQKAPEEEKYLGIITLRVLKSFIVRYKIILTKDGKGYFPASPSLKIVDEIGERYVPSFYLDSHTENDSLMQFIRDKISELKKNKTIDQLFVGLKEERWDCDNV